jgi:hypothetical protein
LIPVKGSRSIGADTFAAGCGGAASSGHCCGTPAVLGLAGGGT